MPQIHTNKTEQNAIKNNATQSIAERESDEKRCYNTLNYGSLCNSSRTQGIKEMQLQHFPDFIHYHSQRGNRNSPNTMHS